MSRESRYDRLEAEIVDGLRRAPGAEPSAELDARILARAHAAVATTPVRRTQPRWMAMAAGVVVLVGSGLALRIMSQVEREPGPVGAPMQSVPAPAAAPQSAASESAQAKVGEAQDAVVADDAFRQDQGAPTSSSALAPMPAGTPALPSDTEAPEKSIATAIAPAPPPPVDSSVVSAPAIAPPLPPRPPPAPKSRPQAFPADDTAGGYGPAPAAPAAEVDKLNDFSRIEANRGSDQPVAPDADLAGAAASATAEEPAEPRREEKQLAQPFETRTEDVATRAPESDLRDRAAQADGRLEGTLERAAPETVTTTGATVPRVEAPATSPVDAAPAAPEPARSQSMEENMAEPAPPTVTEEREGAAGTARGGLASKPGTPADAKAMAFAQRIVAIRTALARGDRVWALNETRRLARDYPDQRLPGDLALLIAR